MIDEEGFTIIPRAGEYMLLDKAEGGRIGHTLFQCPTSAGKGILVTPTVDGNLLVGPTAKSVESPNSNDTTPEGLTEVERLSGKSVPSINFRQVITSFAGVRSSTENGEFILKASNTVRGLVHAVGIDSPGLTCCVSIAKYLTGILEEEGLVLIKKDKWRNYRENQHAFREMSDDEKNAYIQKHPEFGKIVCRCENVSEGEILQAIRSNPPARDLDAVKRRTRSGMGRCQGGFCGPYVMELLAREMNIPFERITKFGGNSYMVAERIGK